MKFAVSQQELYDYTEHVVSGGLKGFSVGMLASLGAAAVLKRRTNVFQRAGGYHRVMIMVAPGTFTGVVGAEWAKFRFERLQHIKRQQSKGFDLPKLEQISKVEQGGSLRSWISHNKYKIIVGGWAASLAGAFAIINRDRYLSRSQKLVQARVYAQGLTVLMLLASVILSVAYGDAEKTKQESREAAERSWERRFGFVKAANTPMPLERSD